MKKSMTFFALLAVGALCSAPVYATICDQDGASNVSVKDETPPVTGPVAKDTSYCYMNRNFCVNGCDAPTYGLPKDWDRIHACQKECEEIFKRCIGQ